MADKSTWHLDKKVPIGIIATILFQFVGFIWFMSKMDSRIAALEEKQHETSQVVRDFYTVEPTLENIENTLTRIDTRQRAIEDRFNRFLERESQK